MSIRRSDLIPLVTSQITFSQIYIRSNEDRFTDWASFVEYAKAQDGKGTIANVSREGSMERLNLKFIMDHFGFGLQQISFDKGGPRYGALKGGQVDALFEQPGDVRGFLDSGDFKPILTLLEGTSGSLRRCALHDGCGPYLRASDALPRLLCEKGRARRPSRMA